MKAQKNKIPTFVSTFNENQIDSTTER